MPALRGARADGNVAGGPMLLILAIRPSLACSENPRWVISRHASDSYDPFGDPEP
jgi:hypothetical protein